MITYLCQRLPYQSVLIGTVFVLVGGGFYGTEGALEWFFHSTEGVQMGVEPKVGIVKGEYERDYTRI